MTHLWQDHADLWQEGWALEAGEMLATRHFHRFRRSAHEREQAEYRLEILQQQLMYLAWEPAPSSPVFESFVIEVHRWPGGVRRPIDGVFPLGAPDVTTLNVAREVWRADS